jgi:hypothetical protein
LFGLAWFLFVCVLALIVLAVISPSWDMAINCIHAAIPMVMVFFLAFIVRDEEKWRQERS